MTKVIKLKVNDISIALWAIAFSINVVVTSLIFALAILFKLFVGDKK